MRRRLIREPYYSSPGFIQSLPDENGDFKYILNRKYLDLFRHPGGTVSNPGWRDCEVLGLKEYEKRLNRIIKEKQLELDERLKGNKIYLFVVCLVRVWLKSFLATTTTSTRGSILPSIPVLISNK